MFDRPGERVVIRAAVAVVLHLRISCRRDRHLISVRQGRYRRRRAVRNAHRVALLAVRHRVLVLRVLRTVVLPLAVSRFDLQFRLVLRNLQLAVGRRHQVVAYRSLGARRHCNAVHRRDHVRLRADIRDRAGIGHNHREGVLVALLQISSREARLCQCAAIIRLARILRRDRNLLGINRQRAVLNFRDLIVAVNVSVTNDFTAWGYSGELDPIFANICFSAMVVRKPDLERIKSRCARIFRRYGIRIADLDLVGIGAMGLTVVSNGYIVCDDLDRQRCDRQLARSEGLGFIVVSDVLTLSIDDSIRLGKGTGIRAARNSRALGGGVGDGQDVALAQALDRVIIGRDRLAGAGDGRDKGAAFLLGAVVHLFDVLDRDLKGRLGDRQGAEVLNYLVVVGIDRAPIDAVAVLRAARIGDRASRCDGGLARIRRNEAGETRFSIGQRRAVIGLLSAAGGGSQLRWEDLQTAGTDVQADTVIIVLRQIRKRQTNIIGIIARVGFRDPVIV